jgi:hypothetical protein
VHVIIAIADHFEPAILPGVPQGRAPFEEQERRLEEWCRRYPSVVAPWPDSDGVALRHTYFYPAEQYDKRLIDRLVGHVREGWGEIEIHLHHGVESPADGEETRHLLVEFRDTLASRDCLSRWDGRGDPRYAFVHGNWALANSGGGLFCGVDSELQILAETGCYADMTLPAAPDRAQVAKVNALYEVRGRLDRRAAHRRGRNLRRGRPVETLPLIVQGPLLPDFGRVRATRPVPGIENGDLTDGNPPSLRRLAMWRSAGIAVEGRPDWIFVKLHCHGMDPRSQQALLGLPMMRFLRDLRERSRAEGFAVHFVTAREMVNIILAACDNRPGGPGDHRDYRLKPI